MNFQIIGQSNTIASRIAQKMGKELIIPQITRFADGEIEVKFPDANQLKDKKVFIVQSTSTPVHDNLMQLLFTIFETKNALAKEVIAVIPYFGYGRHDKEVIPGTQSIVALIAKMLEDAGIDNVITVDIHSEKIKNFFSIPLTNIHLFDLITGLIKNQFSDTSKLCIVAPDKGAQERVKIIAATLGAGYIFFEKQRSEPDKTKIVASQVHCKGSIAIIIDDIIDTGGTAINACNILIDQGYEQIFGYFVHPVLSGNASDIIEKSQFTKIFVSNSIPLRVKAAKINVFDITDILVKKLEISR